MAAISNFQSTQKNDNFVVNHPMKYWITKEESSTMYMYVPVVSLKLCAAVLEFLRRHLKFQPIRKHN
jgi:hypothetical protein